MSSTERTCARPDCGNTFSTDGRLTRNKRYCSSSCSVQNQPSYIRNTELVEICEFYLSLGFTPAQVYDDFVKDERKIPTWLKILHRRGKSKMLSDFRRELVGARPFTGG